jgi:hypothetical protein
MSYTTVEYTIVLYISNIFIRNTDYSQVSILSMSSRTAVQIFVAHIYITVSDIYHLSLNKNLCVCNGTVIIVNTSAGESLSNAL